MQEMIVGFQVNTSGNKAQDHVINRDASGIIMSGDLQKIAMGAEKKHKRNECISALNAKKSLNLTYQVSK